MNRKKLPMSLYFDQFDSIRLTLKFRSKSFTSIHSGGGRKRTINHFDSWLAITINSAKRFNFNNFQINFLFFQQFFLHFTVGVVGWMVVVGVFIPAPLSRFFCCFALNSFFLLSNTMLWFTFRLFFFGCCLQHCILCYVMLCIINIWWWLRLLLLLLISLLCLVKYALTDTHTPTYMHAHRPNTHTSGISSSIYHLFT